MSPWNKVKGNTSQSHDQIKLIIKDKMIEQLRADLTTGMRDNDLDVYSEPQIENYLNDNQDPLDQAVNQMFKDYLEDDELNDILTAPDDWFREYLYEFIDMDQLYGQSDSSI